MAALRRALEMGRELWSSSQGVTEVHRILMQHLEDADKAAPVVPGRYRTHAAMAHSTGMDEMQFAAPEDIAAGVDRLLRDVRASLDASIEAGPDVGMFRIAGHVLVKFVRIHPFGDGNGRVCRILVNSILALHGVDVLVPLVGGLRRRARKHFVEVLFRCQTGRSSMSMAYLYVLVL
eukprot:m.305223 g.305223  ORF g.305223 m.305223 type:complete len:177 (-) comp17611_c0_seq1:99-629(-)